MRKMYITAILVIAILAVSLAATNVIAAKGGVKGKPDKPGDGGGRLKALADVAITYPSEGADFDEGALFTVTALVTCLNKDCKGVTVSITLPAGLSLSGSPQQYNIGNMAQDATVTRSWTVSADDAGNYQIDTITTGTKGTQGDADNVNVDVISPPQYGTLTPEITSPSDNSSFSVNTTFQVTVNVSCTVADCGNVTARLDVEWYPCMPGNYSCLILPDNDEYHGLGYMDVDTWQTTTWNVKGVGTGWTWIATSVDGTNADVEYMDIIQINIV